MKRRATVSMVSTLDEQKGILRSYGSSGREYPLRQGGIISMSPVNEVAGGNN